MERLTCLNACQFVANDLPDGSTITGHAFVSKVQRLYRDNGQNPPEPWTIMRARRMVRNMIRIRKDHPKHTRGQKSLYLVNHNYDEILY